MRDDRTRFGYKPEHGVGLDTGAIVAAPIHWADQGATKTFSGTLEAEKEDLEAVGKESTPEDPAQLVADKGCHSSGGLKSVENSAWKSRISEPKANGINRWKGDDEAKRAFYSNRARLLSELARQAFKLRAELVERSFALTLDRAACAGLGYVVVTIRKTVSHQRLQSRPDDGPPDQLRHSNPGTCGWYRISSHQCESYECVSALGRRDYRLLLLRYPINHQTAVLLGCLVVMDGPLWRRNSRYRGLIGQCPTDRVSNTPLKLGII